MTRAISAEIATALQQRRVEARDFLWFVVKDRVTGAPVTDGEWSDVGVITASVIDPDTGGTVERTWNGSGTLISVSDVPLISDITVQNVTITLSQVNDRIQDLVRTYECKQGIVQLFRGLYDPATQTLVSPAVPRFVGFIDKIDINTPTEGNEGGVVLACVSHTQEMTRYNPDTRSDASQRLRSITDDFYADTTVVAGWQISWGRASGPVVSSGQSAFNSMVSNFQASFPL